VRLIRELKADWSPERYTDEYRNRLEHAIEQRAKTGHIKPVGSQSAPPANVINLMERLQRSLQQAGKQSGRKAAAGGAQKRSPTSAKPRKPARKSRRAA
jgi:DNA end-binding protein Ku